MKKSSKMQIFAWVLSILPMLLVAAVYTRLPAQVPMQWGFDGAVRYDDKWQLLIIALLPVVFAVLFPLLPRLDPKRKSYDKFRSSYDLFQVMMMLFLLVLIAVCVVEALRPGTVNVVMAVCLLCGLLFTALGNMMPKFRPNWFCGIRNPWTISSESVWQRTHHLGGRLFFASGLFAILGAFVPNDTVRLVLVFAPMSVAVLVPTVLSYRWYQQEKRGG